MKEINMEVNNYLQFSFKTKQAANAFCHYCHNSQVLNKRISHLAISVLIQGTDGRVEKKAREIAEKVSKLYEYHMKLNKEEYGEKTNLPKTN